MAKLKNLTTTRIIFRSVNDVDYDILPGATLTVFDAEVVYTRVDSAIENGWLEVTTDAGQPFFDAYGNIAGSGAGIGMPVDTGLLQPLTNTELRAEPLEVSVVPADPIERVPSIYSSTEEGSVATGAIHVSVANVGDAPATVAGGPLPPFLAVSFSAPAGDTLSAIDFDATGTVLVISEVR